MKRRLWIASMITLIIVGCESSNSNDPQIKPIVGGKLLLDISAKTIKDKLTSEGWPIDEYSVYGYKAYKIPYVTKDDNNVSVNVSGLLVIPTDVSTELQEEGLALLSYGHGTIALNNSAPTVFTEKYKLPLESAIIFTSLGGFATLQADYIGYGDSLGHHHPYVMQKSLANTSIDFITAVKEFTQDNNIKINDKLFITGYSEGGYTAMSTLKRLEALGIPVAAAAPMAGAYDLTYMADAALGFVDESLTGYIMTYNALTINAYTKNYDKNISSIVKEPYDSKIESLLDGFHSFEQINNTLHNNASGLFHESFIKDYKNNDRNWFKLALTENSIHNWIPKTPLRLIHCKGDDQVPYTISQKTYDTMISNGTEDVILITPDDNQADAEKWDHGECFYPALQTTALWFVEMRED